MKFKNQSKILFGLALAYVAVFGAVTAKAASNSNETVFASQTGQTSIPVGHAMFCKDNPQECHAINNPVKQLTLTASRWQQLLQVNHNANTQIKPVTDRQLYAVSEHWAFPRGAGDCEDYALHKRRELIRAGWPESTLLVSAVRETNGNGHAVLMVRTDRGDFILDNQQSLILAWNETPYKFLKRQSQSHSGKWVDLRDNRSNLQQFASN